MYDIDPDQPPRRSPALPERGSKKVSAEPGSVSPGVIHEDGLRYKAKTAGSPFAGQAGSFGGTMSCFKCGGHRPIQDLETKKILGKNHKVCKGGCAKKKS